MGVVKNRNKGATIMEYTIILSLVSVVIIAAFQNLGNVISDFFNSVDSVVDENYLDSN